MPICFNLLKLFLPRFVFTFAELKKEHDEVERPGLFKGELQNNKTV